MGWIFNRNRRASAQYDRNRNNRMTPRYTSPPAKNTAEWMAAFATNPRLAVVDKISSDLSWVGGKLYQVDSRGQRTEILTHPFLDFWNRPNPLHEFTASALWRLQNNYLLLKGEGYFIIERDMQGRPAELWPVPTHWVQMTPYQGYPNYKVRATDGSVMDVSVDDMFVMKDLNPIDPYKRGLGQAEQIADEIEIDEYAAKFQKKFFFNDATPNTVVNLPGANEEQTTRFRAKWKEWFRGAENSHGIAVLGGPREAKAEVFRLADNMKDLDMVNGRLYARDAALEHFGVPREIMGITQNSNRATAEAAQYIHAANVLTPRLRAREEAVNRQLLPAFGADLVWEYDDIIPQDKEFEKGVAMDGWNNGLLMQDQALEKLGVEPAKNGRIYKTGFADLYMDADEDRAQVSSAAANLQYADDPDLMEEGEEEGRFDAEEKLLHRASQIKAKRAQAAGRSLAATRIEQERKFEGATNQYFRGQSQRVRKVLLGATKDDDDIWESLNMTPEEFGQLTAEQQESLLMQFVEGLTDWKQEAIALESLFTPLWSETYDKGVENIVSSYRLRGVQQPALTSTARLRGGQRVTRISQTTKDAIRTIVTDGLTTGMSQQTIADNIMFEMDTSAGRARTIAAQECNTSLLAGNFDMAKRGGFSQKTWHVTNTGKARDTHLGLNGKTVLITEPFITARGNKLMMPCDPDCDKAEEVCNCHCFLTYS
ncbi:MAG: phage portal protein [Lachnospiraceae bacterium]